MEPSSDDSADRRKNNQGSRQETRVVIELKEWEEFQKY